MNTPQLCHPVYTPDKKILIDAGEILTPAIMDELIRMHKHTAYREFTFSEHSTLYQDILHYLQRPPYHVIFDAPRRTEALSMMERISFIQPILESFEYFKEHDYYTYRHILTVFALTVITSLELLKNSKGLIVEAMAGTMHDIGKMCVPLEILKKRGPLTRSERLILEHHTLSGYILLSCFFKTYRCFPARVCKEHHERRDSSGYPLGIPLKNHMIEIIAVCDVYDALLSRRPYRSTPFDNRSALEEISDIARQGKLSWDIVQVLVSLNRKNKPPFRECRISSERRGSTPADSSYGTIKD